MQAFRVLPYLTHVTATGIRVNMIPDDSFDLRVSIGLPHTSYGVVPGVTAQVTQTGATADTRTHLVAAPNPTFTGLTAGTDYKYLVECRAAAGAPWEVVQKAYFRTLQTDTAATVKVGIMSDSHAYEAAHRAVLAATGVLAMTVDQARDFFAPVIANMGTRSIDFIVDGGDTAMPHCLGCLAFTYTRENGDTVSFTTGDALDQAEVNARYEVFLSIFQPILAFKPYFMAVGNHEEIQHYGGVGAAEVCTISQDETSRALVGFNAMLGNYSDAYPADTGDMDGDTVAEVQNDGLYYEFASGSLRWFFIDNLRYGNDTAAAGATPASQFAGFAARTDDQPTATFGNCPSSSWPADGTDTYEDNATLGGEQTAWLIARAAAKAEAFGAVISHRITGGIGTGPNYFYQRGLVATGDSDMDGRVETTDDWDADGDGDLSDENYIAAEMVSNAIQLRFTGHDHEHLICRKDGIHYIRIGRPICGSPGQENCFPDWYDTGTDAANQLLDVDDCDEDGELDFDEAHNRDGRIAQVANEGTSGINGTPNPGFGVLTVNGSTNMQWEWVVTDEQDAERNNDSILTYGPIAP